MLGWFSSQMETVPGRRPDKILQAVGDPFYFLQEPPRTEWGTRENGGPYAYEGCG